MKVACGTREVEGVYSEKCGSARLKNIHLPTSLRYSFVDVDIQKRQSQTRQARTNCELQLSFSILVFNFDTQLITIITLSCHIALSSHKLPSVAALKGSSIRLHLTCPK